MDTRSKARVAILGASGYSGGELLRLLAHHPKVEVKAVSANSQAGKRIEEIHPHLRGLYHGNFSSLDDTFSQKDLDIVFLALPHGESHRLLPEVPKNLKVIDLSGDFRLKDPLEYKKWYGKDHKAEELISDFVYGLTEWFAPQIAVSNRIANPGCFATAVLLGLIPLCAKNLLAGPVIVDAKTGSSGSGVTPSMQTHHPIRAHGLNAYKAFQHQHEPEILQTLRSFGRIPDLIFQPHSVPLVRGIYATIYAPLSSAISKDALGEIFESYYDSAPFIRLCKNELPNVGWVQGSNFTDIGWETRGHFATIFVALDNLVKGAAGQAIQNLNLMLGEPQTLGLHFPGLLP